MSSEHDPDHDALDADADDDSFNDADDGGQMSDDSFNDEPHADEEEEEEEDGGAPRAAISASASSHSMAFEVGTRKVRPKSSDSVHPDSILHCFTREFVSLQLAARLSRVCADSLSHRNMRFWMSRSCVVRWTH